MLEAWIEVEQTQFFIVIGMYKVPDGDGRVELRFVGSVPPCDSFDALGRPVPGFKLKLRTCSLCQILILASIRVAWVYSARQRALAYGWRCVELLLVSWGGTRCSET